MKRVEATSASPSRCSTANSSMAKRPNKSSAWPSRPSISSGVRKAPQAATSLTSPPPSTPRRHSERRHWSRRAQRVQKESGHEAPADQAIRDLVPEDFVHRGGAREGQQSEHGQ